MLRRERVEVGVVLHEAGRHKLLHEFVAEALDVHRIARGEESQPLPRSGRAVDVGATDIDTVVVLHQRRATFGAVRRKLPGRKPPLPKVLLDSDHVRNHLARLLDHEHVADADVLAGDLVGVVEARPADGRAGKFHRFEVGHRRDRAAAAHLHADAGERGRGLVLLELPGDRPARTLGRGAQQPLLIEAVDLHDEAVDLEVERVKFFDEFGATLHKRVDRTKHLRTGGHREPSGHRPGEQVGLRRGAEAGRISHAVAEEPQRPGGALPRVEQADTAGGHVARVGERCQPRLRLRLVERDEIGVGHVDLAANLDRFRWSFEVEHERHARDRADVVGDVVAHHGIAPRGRQREPARVVGERHGHAVDFQLQHPLDRRGDARLGEELLHSFSPHGEIVGAVRVVDRQHRHAVADRLQLGHRFVADPLRGAVGRDEVGMP